MQKHHDDKDDGEEASGDKEEGAREDVNSKPEEHFIDQYFIDWLGRRLTALVFRIRTSYTY